jgi:tetratricopeptide (TPR) repeat protein
VAELSALFEDGGAGFLRDAGLPSWDAALAEAPPPLRATSDGWRLLSGLRDLWNARGNLPAALAASRALHAHRLATLGREHPDTWLELAAVGALLQRRGEVREGASFLDQAWVGLRSVAGGRDPRVAVVAQNVAQVRVRQGLLDEAEHALEVAYRIRKDALPDSVGLVAAQLGEIRVRLGRPKEAVPLLREALELTARLEGPGSPRAQARGHMLGTVLNQLERYKEAVEVLRPVHAAAPVDPEVRASVAFELGLALDRTGAKEEGLRRIEESLRLTRALGDHPSLANRVTLMAQLHADRSRLEEAEGLLREATEIDRRRFGDASAEAAIRQAALGQFLARFGRKDEAVGLLDSACSLLRSTAGDADPRTVAVVELATGLVADQVASAAARKDRELASALVRRGLSLAEPVLGPAHARTRRLRELRDKHRLA